MQSIIAMFNDSWEIFGILDRSEAGFPRLSNGRRALYDLFAMAICVGGLVMIWVSNIDFGKAPKSEAERQKRNIIMAGMWITLAVG